VKRRDGAEAEACKATRSVDPWCASFLFIGGEPDAAERLVLSGGWVRPFEEESMDRTNAEGWTTTRGASSWGRVATVSLWLVAAAIAGCGGDDDGATDASTPMPDGGSPMGDAGMRDDAAMGTDAGTPEDAGETDAGETDAGESDAGGCPVGMAGPDCEECAPGYVDRFGTGECVATCEVEDAIDCGDHGACMESPLDGSLLCQCESGYEGAACDMCEEGFDSVGGECELPDPPALGLSLWLDADAPDSLTLGASNEVLGWADRRSFVALQATPTTGIARPTFQPTGRNGRGAVDFDGVDQLALNGYNGLSATDFEILFAGEPSGATPIGLIDRARALLLGGALGRRGGRGRRGRGGDRQESPAPRPRAPQGGPRFGVVGKAPPGARRRSGDLELLRTSRRRHPLKPDVIHAPPPTRLEPTRRDSRTTRRSPCRGAACSGCCRSPPCAPRSSGSPKVSA
jgi:hypothetical protein